MSAGFSKYKSIIQHYPFLIKDKKPIDVGMMRTLTNNAIHYHDMSGQTRVNFVLSSEFVLSNGNPDNGLRPQSDVFEADQFFPITVGMFPLKLRYDGRPYKLRVRLGGRSPNNSTKTTLSVSFGESLISALNNVDENFSIQAVTSSDSVKWLKGDLVSLPNNLINNAITNIFTKDLQENVTTISQVWIYYVVFGKSDNENARPELWGLHISEYIGEDS